MYVFYVQKNQINFILSTGIQCLQGDHMIIFQLKFGVLYMNFFLGIKLQYFI